MKILHVILSQGFAGSERSTVESCNWQCHRHQVTLAVRRGHRGRGKASIVDHLDPRVAMVELPDRLGTQRALGRLIERVAPDLIHAHLRRSTRLVARLDPAAATVATLHVSYNADCFGAMDGLICNARWQLADIPGSYGGAIFKAHNSLQPHRRLGPDDIAALREDLGGDAGYFHVGGVGRLTWKKGWDVLIKALMAADLGSGVRLNLFGAGSSASSLRRLARNDSRVRLRGYRQNIKDYYQAFDLFVCPSRFEPLPRVMLEAMDGGVPVIASDAGGCRELIEDYGGDLFPSGDVDSLARLLQRRCSEPPRRHRPDLSVHHLPAAAAEMERFYQRLLARRSQDSA